MMRTNERSAGDGYLPGFAGSNKKIHVEIRPRDRKFRLSLGYYEENSWMHRLAQDAGTYYTPISKKCVKETRAEDGTSHKRYLHDSNASLFTKLEEQERIAIRFEDLIPYLNSTKDLIRVNPDTGEETSQPGHQWFAQYIRDKIQQAINIIRQEAGLGEDGLRKLRSGAEVAEERRLESQGQVPVGLAREAQNLTDQKRCILTTGTPQPCADVDKVQVLLPSCVQGCVQHRDLVFKGQDISRKALAEMTIDSRKGEAKLCDEEHDLSDKAPSRDLETSGGREDGQAQQLGGSASPTYTFINEDTKWSLDNLSMAPTPDAQPANITNLWQFVKDTDKGPDPDSPIKQNAAILKMFPEAQEGAVEGWRRDDMGEQGYESNELIYTAMESDPSTPDYIRAGLGAVHGLQTAPCLISHMAHW